MARKRNRTPQRAIRKQTRKPRNKSVQFAKAHRLATTRGHIMWFRPGVPRNVTQEMYDEAMRQGGVDGDVDLSSAREDAESADEEGDDLSVEKVAEAMREIINEGDPEKLTDNQEVRMSALRDELGTDDVTTEDRDAAKKMLDEGAA